MKQEESTPMTTLFEYIEDGSKLHSIISMKAVFMQYERVWLAKHLSQACNWTYYTDKADAIIEDIYKNEK